MGTPFRFSQIGFHSLKLVLSVGAWVWQTYIGTVSRGKPDYLHQFSQVTMMKLSTPIVAFTNCSYTFSAFMRHSVLLKTCKGSRFIQLIQIYMKYRSWGLKSLQFQQCHRGVMSGWSPVVFCCITVKLRVVSQHFVCQQVMTRRIIIKHPLVKRTFHLTLHRTVHQIATNASALVPHSSQRSKHTFIWNCDHNFVHQ